MAITVGCLYVQFVCAGRQVLESCLAQGCIYIVPLLVITFQVLSILTLVGIEIRKQRKLNTKLIYR